MAGCVLDGAAHFEALPPFGINATHGRLFYRVARSTMRFATVVGVDIVHNTHQVASCTVRYPPPTALERPFVQGVSVRCGVLVYSRSAFFDRAKFVVTLRIMGDDA